MCVFVCVLFNMVDVEILRAPRDIRNGGLTMAE